MYLSEVQRVLLYQRLYDYYVKQMQNAHDDNSYRAFEVKAKGYLSLIELYERAI